MEEHSISSDLIRGHIDTIILHTLLDGDKFAQTISETVEQKSNGGYILNQASLYSSLKRLESSELVSSYWNDSVEGRRKYFKITDKGRKTVEENLSSWSFSKEILNKLMGVNESTQVQIIEKIVEKPVVVENEKTEINVKISPEILPQNNVNIVNETEINYRSVLNGLIQSDNIQDDNKENQTTELKPFIVEKRDEKLDFNETIDDKEYNKIHKNGLNGKIDYNELIEEAKNEGYKLRIYSKESAKQSNGNLYKNKLNFITFLTVLIFIIAECSFFYFTQNTFVTEKIILGILSLGIVILLVFAFLHLKDKTKTTSKKISKSNVSTSAIILFNVIIITFAVNFLLEVDFNDFNFISLTVLSPIMLFFDVFVFYLFRNIFSKFKCFYALSRKKQK